MSDVKTNELIKNALRQACLHEGCVCQEGEDPDLDKGCEGCTAKIPEAWAQLRSLEASAANTSCAVGVGARIYGNLAKALKRVEDLEARIEAAGKRLLELRKEPMDMEFAPEETVDGLLDMLGLCTSLAGEPLLLTEQQAERFVDLVGKSKTIRGEEPAERSLVTSRRRGKRTLCEHWTGKNAAPSCCEEAAAAGWDGMWCRSCSNQRDER